MTMVGFILTALLFIAILSVLVLVHEWGHFIAARMFGVRVEEFGFGFPPRIGGIRKGSTLYSINALPLGGFVKLKGEDGTGLSSADADSFAVQRWWKKLIILAAGVFMNVVLTILLFTIGYTIGMPQLLESTEDGSVARDVNIQVTYVQTGSPAAQSGIRVGDVIRAIDGKAPATIDEIQSYTRSHIGASIRIDAARGAEKYSREITPIVLKETGKGGIGIGIARIGLRSYPLPTAFLLALNTTWALATYVITTFLGALRHLAFDDFVGPVGIASYAGTVAQLGVTYLINLVGQFSMSLAIFNFLPIPALDGGRALFILLERFRGKSISAAVENAIHVAGFMLLIGLLILITIRDISRIFSL